MIDLRYSLSQSHLCSISICPEGLDSHVFGGGLAGLFLPDDPVQVSSTPTIPPVIIRLCIYKDLGT